MIEASPFTINIARLGGESSNLRSFQSDIERYTFSEDRGFGFSIESSGKDKFSAYLIERKPIVLKEFDIESNAVIEQNNYQTDLIPFHIDSEQNVLLVFSNQGDLAKTTSRIGEATQRSFSINSITLDLSELYTSLYDQGLMENLSSIRVQNFQTESGFRGTFTIKNNQSTGVFEFMNEHNGDVSVIRGDITMPSEKMKVAFYRSGGIRLYNRVADEDEFWNTIQNAVSSAII